MASPCISRCILAGSEVEGEALAADQNRKAVAADARSIPHRPSSPPLDCDSLTSRTLGGLNDASHPQQRVWELQQLQLGVVPAAELRCLRFTFMPGFLKDRRNLGVRDEVLPARRIPVEEHPDPVGLIGIAKHGRTLRTVLLSLLSALR